MKPWKIALVTLTTSAAIAWPLQRIEATSEAAAVRAPSAVCSPDRPHAVPLRGLELPPGHPPIPLEMLLPPGHPPISPGVGALPRVNPELPPGHPPIWPAEPELPPGHPPIPHGPPAMPFGQPIVIET